MQGLAPSFEDARQTDTCVHVSRDCRASDWVDNLETSLSLIGLVLNTAALIVFWRRGRNFGYPIR